MIYEGKLNGSGLKIGIVAARFNEFIVSKLVSQAMARTKKYDAIICLGCVIRGATSHYDYVCNEVSKGIAKVSLDENMPVMFGVVTTENIEQAIERAGTKAGNKGYDCAMGALEMVSLLKGIK